MKRRCQQCYQSFSTVSIHRRHERLHNRVNLGKKIYSMKRQCQQCYRSFSTVSNLRRHERLHNRVNLGKKTDITKYPKCMKTFSSYCSRMRHETSCIRVHHHPLSPKLTYVCPICNHHFVSFRELLNHQERTNMCRVEAGGSSVSQQNTPSQPVSFHHSTHW